MKKAMFFISLLLLAILPALAQEGTGPESILEWVTRFPEMIGSFWGVFVSVVLLVPILIGLLSITGASKGVKYVFTGVVALLLIVLARFLPIGYLYGMPFLPVAVDFLFILAMQIIGYAALKPLHDAVTAKFDIWKTPSG